MELLKINGNDYGGYVVSRSGLKLTPERRGCVEIITADGGLYHRYVKKKLKVSVTLEMVPDSVLEKLEHDTEANSFPAVVNGRAGMFSLASDDISASSAVIFEDEIYWTGVIFVMREV